MQKRTTLRDIARLANVSHVTVGLALRNHPRISKATRERVQAIAAQLDYRPDPVLQALMTYRKTVRSPHYQGTLGWVNCYSEPSKLYTYPELNEYWLGAKERCREVGYLLEEFRLHEAGMTPKRLSKILLSRNIQGLLLPPQSRNRAHVNLEWKHFSAVAFGYTLAGPHLHLVTNAQYRSGMIAVRSLRSHGYRRIGIVLEHAYDEKTDYNFSGGYLAQQRRLGTKRGIPPLIFPQKSRAEWKGQFQDWYRKHQPDAILAHERGLIPWLSEIGIETPRDYGFALLTLGENESTYAGIYQNNRLIGSRAVDFLVSAIHRNERGVPETPSRLLIEGRWIDGPTVRRLV